MRQWVFSFLESCYLVNIILGGLVNLKRQVLTCQSSSCCDMALPMFHLLHIDGGTDDHVDGSSVGNDAPGILEDP